MAGTRRGRNEGALFHSPSKDAWVGRIELPPGPNGKRRTKEVQRKSKADLIREMARLRKQYEPNVDAATDVYEDLGAPDALEVIRLQEADARFRIEVSRRES